MLLELFHGQAWSQSRSSAKILDHKWIILTSTKVLDNTKFFGPVLPRAKMSAIAFKQRRWFFPSRATVSNLFMLAPSGREYCMNAVPIFSGPTWSSCSKGQGGISSIYMHTRVRTLTRSISHSAKRISERKPYVPYGRRKQEEPDESEVIFGVVCIRERLRDRSP